MRSFSLLLLAGLLASACASTGPGGTPTPRTPEVRQQGTAARSTSAPELPEKAGRSGALKVVGQEVASLESAAPALVEERSFDPNRVHNRSGLRGPHIGEYFHAEAATESLHSNHSVVLDPDWMVAHFIDVGQGDAILLEFECGAVLIDTGGEDTSEVNGPERLGEYLNTFFARRTDLSRTLDLVVLSHPHRDHTFGVSALTGNLNGVTPIAIRNVIDNGEASRGSGIAGQNDLRRYAQTANAGYQAIRNSDIQFLDGLTSTVIDPINCTGVDPVFRAVWGRDSDAWSSNANNHSVVVRLDFGDTSFLFMGDAQLEALSAMLDSYSADLSILDVDVLKVGHHGSHNATSLAFMQAVTREMAVIQAGDSSLSDAQFSAYSFGHPNRKSINILVDQQFGVSGTRAPVVVDVGVKGRNPTTGALPVFTSITLDRAVYAVSWDGLIIVEAKKDGTMRVLTSK